MKELNLSNGGVLRLSDTLVASMSDEELKRQLRRFFDGMYEARKRAIKQGAAK